MLGIVFALGAMLSWAFGDFFIQRTARVIGIWKSLFFITIVGSLGLLPFVYAEVPVILQTKENLILLGIAIVVSLVAALIDFKALQQGKFAIIEPILGIELPLTVLISVFLLGETLTFGQLCFILLVFLGLISAVTLHRNKLHIHKNIFEKGAWLAVFAAIGMALTNVLFGVTSQQWSPLAAVWFIHTGLALCCIGYLLSTREFTTLWKDLKKYPKMIVSESILDNLAWICFAFATTYIPIAIATTISESYIALGVILGLVVNKEKLKKHQKLGTFVAVSSVILLAAISG
ncbi:MAG: DMT family transporter [Candidatus Woesearchaeota archaeon]|nr:DMT family transporter [Candidatus Woesearchaeota archaeon]